MIWTRTQYKSPAMVGWHSGAWCIYAETDDGPCVVSSGPPHWYGPEHHQNVTAACEKAEEIERIWSKAND